VTGDPDTAGDVPNVEDAVLDEAVVRAAQRGDTVAMTAVLDHLVPYVGRICGPIALSSGSDAAQDTLVAVLRALPTLREPAALHGWVRAIAVREAVRHASRDARARPTDSARLADLPARDDPQLRTDVRAVLDRLSPQHRAVLVLRDLEGLDEAAAAAVLDLPLGTVKSRLHRARQVFRREWTA
jgi:RNA polymerase sigma factor (sigma-70 family)